MFSESHGLLHVSLLYLLFSCVLSQVHIRHAHIKPWHNLKLWHVFSLITGTLILNTKWYCITTYTVVYSRNPCKQNESSYTHVGVVKDLSFTQVFNGINHTIDFIYNKLLLKYTDVVQSYNSVNNYPTWLSKLMTHIICDISCSHEYLWYYLDGSVWT